MRPRALFATVAAALALGAAVGTAPARADAADVELFNQRVRPASAISAANAGELALAWSVETDQPVSHTPLVEDGRVYFGDWGGTVYAVDAASGEILWRNQAFTPMKEWPWHGLAGTGTVVDGRLVEVSVEGEAAAFDTRTGEVLWRRDVARDEQAGNLSTLLAWNGTVFVGLSSVEEPMTKMRKGFVPNFQGKVLALDAATGETVWERVLVEPPHNGVAVWASFALDPALGVLYFTTGNNYTGKATPLSDSLVAVDARTGEILWARQVTQHDVWTPAAPQGPDYDFAAGPQLFSATIDGQVRRLVGAGQKSGYFFVWDRVTGEPVWVTSVGYGGVDGGFHGEASIGEGRVLAWSNNGYHHTMKPERAPISVKALDAATGRQLWWHDKAQPAAIAAGFLASDVYFVGSLDGRVRAYRADDGKQIWRSKAHAPVTSSLWVDEGMLLFGTGTPGILKDWADGTQGLFAYRPSSG